MARYKTVGIIDDDHIYVYGAKRAILKTNFAEDVIVYKNGQEALDGLTTMVEANETLPEILFLDINMPLLDGWQFLDEFIKLNVDQDILIYIVTSSINPADQEKAKSYNSLSNYVVKPITMKKLMELF